VHPSTAPDHLVLLRDGEMVAAGASAEAAEAEAAAASPDSVIEGLEVGSMLTGLSVKLVMHEGQDALAVTSGKLSTSWTTGCELLPSSHFCFAVKAEPLAREAASKADENDPLLDPHERFFSSLGP